MALGGFRQTSSHPSFLSDEASPHELTFRLRLPRFAYRGELEAVAQQFAAAGGGDTLPQRLGSCREESPTPARSTNWRVMRDAAQGPPLSTRDRTPSTGNSADAPRWVPQTPGAFSAHLYKSKLRRPALVDDEEKRGPRATDRDRDANDRECQAKDSVPASCAKRPLVDTNDAE